MTHFRTGDDAPSLTSRIIGAVMAFFFSSLTVISIPWLLAWKFPIRFGLLFGFPLLLLKPMFYIWVLIVALTALHMGYKAGAYDTMDILNTLWKTGDCYDRKVLEMAESLRVTIIVSGIATFLLLCLR